MSSKSLHHVETNVLARGVSVILVVPAIITAVKGKKVSIADHDGNTYTVDPRFLRFIPADFPFKLNRKAEFVTPNSETRLSWTCLCGNVDAAAGFYACDTQGNEIEALDGSGWENLLVCGQCGRIINQDTLQVVGQNPKPKRLE